MPAKTKRVQALEKASDELWRHLLDLTRDLFELDVEYTDEEVIRIEDLDDLEDKFFDRDIKRVAEDEAVVDLILGSGMEDRDLDDRMDDEIGRDG